MLYNCVLRYINVFDNKTQVTKSVSIIDILVS